ncbi:hypothetical protein B0H66DRAFT_552979 [Apodospora peruviana]|uniref:Uncharacterized protein n=1 Tax=Apodospora peruviana TaxID=516989 RepID=A0AAE0IB66_9PEZI|nr:hypothetical protein B0H66DRAFT_552979 [Apodospora peruviana]
MSKYLGKRQLEYFSSIPDSNGNDDPPTTDSPSVKRAKRIQKSERKKGKHDDGSTGKMNDANNTSPHLLGSTPAEIHAYLMKKIEEGKQHTAVKKSGDHDETMNGQNSNLQEINKSLKLLDEKANKANTVALMFSSNLADFKRDILAVEERSQRNEARAAIRHQILFAALKKISRDVNQIKAANAVVSYSKDSDADAAAAGTPGGETPHPKRPKSPVLAKRKSMSLSDPTARSTMERLLAQYMEKMDQAATVDEVRETGKLCIKYAVDLIKTYLD